MKKMNPIPFLTASTLAIFLSACSPQFQRLSEEEIRRVEECPGQVIENAVIEDSSGFVKTIQIRKTGNRCFSKPGAHFQLKKMLCDSGWAMANIYNIEAPGFLNGPCYLGDADIYKDFPAYQVADRPVIKLDTLTDSGLEFAITARLGSALGGNQADPGLEPKPNVNKTYLGINGIYFFNRFGMEGDADFYGTATATNDGYEPLSLFLCNVYRLGGTAYLWKKEGLLGKRRISISLGGNLTTIRLADEFITFIGPWANTSTGTGLGFYMKCKMVQIFRKGFLFGAGLKYEYENPKLPGALESLNAHTLQFMIEAGYKIP